MRSKSTDAGNTRGKYQEAWEGNMKSKYPATNSSGQEIRNKITEEKIDHYMDITSRAFEKLKIVAPEPSHMKKIAEDFHRMARSYYADANHFRKEGDYINAFAAVNYAHGWLDAGARLGLFDVDGDNQLFTLSE